MAQINFRIDDDVKAEAESLFASLGMNTTTALMIFIRQSLSEHAIPFAIRQVTPSQRYAEELTARIRDLESGANSHVHELLDADGASEVRSSRAAKRGVHSTVRAPRRTHHAKALA